MSGAIPLLPQYAFMAWCSLVKEAQGQLYLLPLLEWEIQFVFMAYDSNGRENKCIQNLVENLHGK
jgi:hypothetical protein